MKKPFLVKTTVIYEGACVIIAEDEAEAKRHAENIQDGWDIYDFDNPMNYGNSTNKYIVSLATAADMANYQIVDLEEEY